MSGCKRRHHPRWEDRASALWLFVVMLMLAASPCSAVTKVFEREYTYQASEADSKLSSRTFSLAEVKRGLLEELGTYLESITEVKNFQLTRDEITVLTAGIVKVEIVDERWDGKTYWLKARIAADPDEVIKSIDALRKDRETTKKLNKITKENQRLKEELKKLEGKTQEEKQEEYLQNTGGLSAVEWLKRGILLSFDSGNYNAAVDAFTKAIELDPRLINAYSFRGNAYFNLGDYKQAIRDYNKAIKLSPLDREYAYIYYNRGNVYYMLGDHQQAIRDYKIAARLGLRDAQNFLRTRRISW